MNKCVVKHVWKEVKHDWYNFFIHDIKYHLQDFGAFVLIFAGVILSMVLFIVTVGFIVTRLSDTLPNDGDTIYAVGGTILIFTVIVLGAILKTIDYFGQKIERAKKNCLNEN